ncbi:hypothetical protein FB451DRAFT_1050595 [Mycena latifolia]|nr:hypothetical protein FB451DRAFT_1050595 [Mycena latifolia]
MGVLSPVIPALPESLSFAGKSALVTGANAGLGLASWFHLAQRHVSTLILAVRSRKAGESTRSALLLDPIVRALPTPPTILIYELDLARPSSVAAFATKILAEVPTLNILLLNAGIGTLAWQTTPETNTEQMFQINYLSNAILSVRLLPLLRRSAETSRAPSYLTVVGSRAQAQHSYVEHPIPETAPMFAFLNDRANYRSMQRYADSKVLVSMWLRALAERVDASVVTVNNVCPGLVNTNISDKEAWWLRGIVAVIQAVRGRSPEVGARALIYATSAGSKTHGEMLIDYNVWDNKILNTDQARSMQKRLWGETLAAADSAAPGSVQTANLVD